MLKRKDLNWVIRKGNFGKLAKGNGKNLFLVDTGVIIDFEDFYHSNGREESILPASILHSLERECQLIITDGVLEEITKHTQVRKGERYEISSSTSILVNRIHEDSRYFLEEYGLSRIPFYLKESHRYAVTLAAFEAFKIDYRKGVKDKISNTDKEILHIALDLHRCEQNGIGAINILSTDDHVLRTAGILKDLVENVSEDFSEYGIRALNSRGDLRSYLSQ
jgi:hypothetical protein